ncbi:MAG: hypothetical protein SVU32_07330 [Candidatus Nanohaloarchaea archaeon]|nr:hypothetical protein [Candidatus Nanohaloarchaea archaeon]
MDETSELLDDEEELGVNGLALEIILEDPDPHVTKKSVPAPPGPNRMKTVYDYEEQLESFKESVNTFLNEHRVYSVDTQTIEIGGDRYRNEARIIYKEE